MDARAGGDDTAPAVVSEPDLFLRLCPAPTIGVTGTKGKTTTSSLAAAILAADPAHPAVLGGNIGIPLVERLPELTTGHRVVYELSELQLPTLSRGTTVAVYTNVTSDHLDRHGSLERYRLAKRRLAELVDPAGALVLNADDPVVAAYADASRAPVVSYRPTRAGRGRPRRGRRLDRRRSASSDSGSPAAAPLRRARTAGSCPLGELAIPGAHNVSNALAAVAVGLLFGIEPDAIRAAAGAFAGVEHRLEPVAIIDGVRFVNDSQGTQPDAVIAALRAFDPPIVLIAGGRDKGVDLSGLPPVVAERAVAAVLIGESGPRLEAAVPRGRARPHGRAAATLEEAVRVADALAREALRRRRPPRSGDRAAQPGRRELRHVRGLRRPGPGVQGRRRRARGRAPRRGAAMNLAPPIPRLGTPAAGSASSRPRSSARPPTGSPPARERGRRPARAPPGRLHDPRRGRRPHRDRHPDGLLVVGDPGLPLERATRSPSSARRSSGPSWASSRWS